MFALSPFPCPLPFWNPRGSNVNSGLFTDALATNTGEILVHSLLGASSKRHWLVHPVTFAEVDFLSTILQKSTAKVVEQLGSRVAAGSVAVPFGTLLLVPNN